MTLNLEQTSSARQSRLADTNKFTAQSFSSLPTMPGSIGGTLFMHGCSCIPDETHVYGATCPRLNLPYRRHVNSHRFLVCFAGFRASPTLCHVPAAASLVCRRRPCAFRLQACCENHRKVSRIRCTLRRGPENGRTVDNSPSKPCVQSIDCILLRHNADDAASRSNHPRDVCRVLPPSPSFTSPCTSAPSATP